MGAGPSELMVSPDVSFVRSSRTVATLTPGSGAFDNVAWGSGAASMVRDSCPRVERAPLEPNFTDPPIHG